MRVLFFEPGLQFGGHPLEDELFFLRKRFPGLRQDSCVFNVVDAGVL
jgi:hypothetical protein